MSIEEGHPQKHIDEWDGINTYEVQVYPKSQYATDPFIITDNISCSKETMETMVKAIEEQFDTKEIKIQIIVKKIESQISYTLVDELCRGIK